MAYEKDCDLVTTLKGTEYIRALAEDGSTVRIPVVELGKVMAQVMPVATSEGNGMMSKSNLLQIGKLKTCDKGPTLGVSSVWLMIQTNNSKTDFQFCLEIIDCNNYTSDKPTSILLKGYNANNTANLNHFYYSSNKVLDNILGGYVGGKLTFLVPEFALYDSAMVRVIDDNNRPEYNAFDFTMDFMLEEPNWESRFIAK